MKNAIIIFFTVSTLIFGQQVNPNIDVLNCDLPEIESISIPATGSFYELVIPIGFVDRNYGSPDSVLWPVITNNALYPKCGVFADGVLLKNYISTHGGSIPIEDWYEPMLDTYFDTQSNGLHSVNFEFIKTPNGNPYTPYDSLAYFQRLNNNNTDIIWNEWEVICEQVLHKIYLNDPNIISSAAAIHFVFNVAGTYKSEFSDEHGGTIHNLSTTYFDGPISINWKTDYIPHERLHMMGLPDRVGFWTYDIMDNRGVLMAERSLFCQRPIRTLDIINFGWISTDEILIVDKNNYENFDNIKLADINYTLTSSQQNNGFYRVVKVMYDYATNEYFLIEFHNASEFDKAFSNVEEYDSFGYNSGVLIWHVRDVSVDLEVAVPYNGWGNRTPIPDDGYPRGNYYRPDDYLGEVGGPDFDYLDDIGREDLIAPDMVDGGKHIWSETLDNYGDPNNPMEWLMRASSKRSDFFTDRYIQGNKVDIMNANTRPSTLSQGWTERIPDPDTGGWMEVNHYPENTGIAITDIKRQNSNGYKYMTVKVSFEDFSSPVPQSITKSLTPIPDEPASYYPTLSWDPVDLPDFDHFNVYKARLNPITFTLLDSTSHTTFIDTSESVSLFAGYKESEYVYYYIASVFTPYEQSAPSDTVSFCVNTNGDNQSKIAADDIKTIPLQFKLHQNYPNPFNPSTEIKFDIPKNSFVNITLYNSVGELIKVLVNKVFEAARYSITFNANNLPSGIYFYRITTNEFTKTKKMILLR